MDDFDWIKDVSYTEEEVFIINLIDSCDKEPYGDGFSYKKGDKQYFYQGDNNKRFHFDYYNVRKVLESKFGLNYQEQKDLIGGVLERHYNLKGYTTSIY